MDSEAVVDIYQSRKCKQLSEVEINLIKGMCQIYDPYYVRIAARFADGPMISAMANTLVQLCGFPETVPCILGWTLKSREEVQKQFSQETLGMYDRLREITGPFTDAEMEEITTGDKAISSFYYQRPSFNKFMASLGREPKIKEVSVEDAVSPYFVWKSQVERALSKTERDVLDRVVNTYGVALVRRAVYVLGGLHGDENTRIQHFEQWINAALKKDYSLLESITPKRASAVTQLNWGIPAPQPFLALRYYWAKSGSIVSNEECEQLQELIDDSSLEWLLFLMSGIPVKDFSLEEIAKAHYASKDDSSGLACFAEKYEERIYFCHVCNKYMTLDDPWWMPGSAGYPGECPSCYAPIKEHGVSLSLEHIQQKYGDLISDYDYSNMGVYFTAYFCEKCGHYVEDRV